MSGIEHSLTRSHTNSWRRRVKGEVEETVPRLAQSRPQGKTLYLCLVTSKSPSSRRRRRRFRPAHRTHWQQEQSCHRRSLATLATLVRMFCYMFNVKMLSISMGRKMIDQRVRNTVMPRLEKTFNKWEMWIPWFKSIFRFTKIWKVKKSAFRKKW